MQLNTNHESKICLTTYTKQLTPKSSPDCNCTKEVTEKDDIKNETKSETKVQNTKNTESEEFNLNEISNVDKSNNTTVPNDVKEDQDASKTENETVHVNNHGEAA